MAHNVCPANANGKRLGTAPAYRNHEPAQLRLAPQNTNHFQSCPFKQPRHWENKRDVDKHVDHRKPVYRYVFNIIEIHKNVSYHRILDPLEGIAHWD